MFVCNTLSELENKVETENNVIKVEPTKIDIHNIRIERQKRNDILASQSIIDKKLTKKNINIKEYKRLIKSYEEKGYTEKDILDKCEVDDMFLHSISRNISINASRQGTRDELLQLITVNSTSSKFGICIEKLNKDDFIPTKNGKIVCKSDVIKESIKKIECLKSFDARISGKIEGWVSAKLVIGKGGHQDNVFEEEDTLCAWFMNFGGKEQRLIVLIDTDLFPKVEELKEKYKNIENILIGNHEEVQRYIIDNYSLSSK